MDRKSLLSLVICAAAVYYYKSTARVSSYRDKLRTWVEPRVKLEWADHIDQTSLYDSVDEMSAAEVRAGDDDDIPDWLTGTLLSDGPGLFEFGDEEALHAFDGMAMIRRYHVSEGEKMNYSRQVLTKSEILVSTTTYLSLPPSPPFS